MADAGRQSLDRNQWRMVTVAYILRAVAAAFEPVLMKFRGRRRSFMMSQPESKAHAGADFLNFVPAMFAMQKEYLHTIESANRDWLARARKRSLSRISSAISPPPVRSPMRHQSAKNALRVSSRCSPKMAAGCGLEVRSSSRPGCGFSARQSRARDATGLILRLNLCARPEARRQAVIFQMRRRLRSHVPSDRSRRRA
jgi:hypothetical protein